ncbi:NAD-dependent protein deacetylase [Pseudomonas sp. DTU_2021_1001937_2_SI_NGA_ILE_001]|uniref:NAD-dependent protein deacetylase n=1 Tax=Pseudomonas sp. DTU_2021_1001937_2_SI_NGA_ILE_001 TaxID=3077589 RepID=UPI0028FC2E16|nr:NAD-dependent protein deacetylase [Pseudomonas sp. DTU_2021_1001937_2_SI_NGA_ILE_001]WNW10526.1 NAD-dependent protein deacetylase [Pseudomonas sp. DTU_2021_1001937_2_SI_NGA_ILE_001]
MPDSLTLERLCDYLQQPLLVISGAGISTASGIPDYRDRDGVRRGKQPMMYQEFLNDPAARQRYWARALLGWPRILAAQPNAAHQALASLQQAGRIGGLITQNVDALHARAGSDATELHGSLHRVLCLDCGRRFPRADIQARMLADNPYMADVQARQAPDGDTLLDPVYVADFQVPPCPACQGLRLKPDVVFFGENVASATAARAAAQASAAPGLLVVGSSLMAWSAFRLCKAMAEDGKPILAINQGKTRADPLITARTAQPCELLLPSVVQALG